MFYHTARMIKKGLSKEEIIQKLERKLIPNVNAFIYVESLDFLRRSGRISRLQHFIARILDLKPLVTLENGKIKPLGRVRGKDVILNSLKKIGFKNKESISRSKTLVVGHSRSKTKAEKLADYMQSITSNKLEIFIWEIGPTLGVHTGPGALSLLWIEG